jgi:hypothetical protein
VPPATSGVDAKAPNLEPAGRRKRHRTARPPTVADEIRVAAIARVELRVAFGWVQPADAADADAAPGSPTTAANAEATATRESRSL